MANLLFVRLQCSHVCSLDSHCLQMQLTRLQQMALRN